MPDKRLAIMGVPSSAGARRGGQEEGPRALRQAGLVGALQGHGFDVIDHGDLPEVAFRPDPEHPKGQNRELVIRVALDVAAAVATSSNNGRLPVILGGDCSISIGVVSALLQREPDLGLLYFDGDLDLNTPETTPSGAFDGMVTAHLFGRGDDVLAQIGPRNPLLEESQVAYFGYNETDGGIDPWELYELERSPALRYPLRSVREDPLGTAREALDRLDRRTGRFLLHFDIDVTSVSAVDVQHPSGLPLDVATSILEVFLASSRCAGLVVTEFNPQLDEDGSTTPRLVDRLSQALAAALQ